MRRANGYSLLFSDSSIYYLLAMTDEDGFNQFLPEERSNKDKHVVEIPAEPMPLQLDRLPSGYEPMGEIQLRGRAWGGLARGRAPWWVLITSWAIWAGFVWLMVYAMFTASFMFLIPLAIAIPPFLILLRGTRAKLASQNRRR